MNNKLLIKTWQCGAGKAST